MLKKIVTVTALTAVSGTALAHTGHGLGSGFSAGLSHPLLGMDHLLAALAVGLVASRSESKVRWSMPLLFTVMLALGFAASAMFTPALFEGGILASLFGLAALLMVRKVAAIQVALLAVAGFALFHGSAHGSEAPLGAGIGYIAALLASTFTLHVAGLFAGARMNELLLRLSGAALAGAGLALSLS